MKIYNSQEFTNIKDNLTELTFIPTMGNLHDGHLSLINKAKEYENEIISSIFINRLQFNEKNDYEKYPKPSIMILSCLKEWL